MTTCRRPILVAEAYQGSGGLWGFGNPLMTLVAIKPVDGVPLSTNPWVELLERFPLVGEDYAGFQNMPTDSCIVIYQERKGKHAEGVHFEPVVPISEEQECNDIANTLSKGIHGKRHRVKAIDYIKGQLLPKVRHHFVPR